MPRPIEAAGTTTAAFVGLAPQGPVSQPVKVMQLGEFERAFSAAAVNTPLGNAVRHFFENGGSEAHVVGANITTQSGIVGNESDKSGIYALDCVELFNILVMPDDSVDVGAQTEAIAYCARRRAFMIIDLPETVATAAAAEAWMRALPPALRSSNAALYFPRVQAPDPSTGVVRSFPAAGAIAGVYSRTDIARGVWKAPAGKDAKVLGVEGLTVELSDNDNAKLNPIGLNCLRTFPAYGTVCWGARTARGADDLADEFKYVPVRRLALFLEESVWRGTRWVASEPNGEPLWAELRESVSAFMHTLFKQGAFSGIKPEQAYVVKCDASTTTRTDIDAGRVNIEIGFAPLKRGEFIIIRIQQTISGG